MWRDKLYLIKNIPLFNKYLLLVLLGKPVAEISRHKSFFVADFLENKTAVSFLCKYDRKGIVQWEKYCILSY